MPVKTKLSFVLLDVPSNIWASANLLKCLEKCKFT